LGLYSAYLFGVGYEGINAALSGQLVLVMLLALMLLKIVATSLTIGSGGSGGIFAPSLFIGAMLGTAVGYSFGMFFPALTAPAGAYGIVGMAALFAGAARAPFTAILIIFEMTGDYNIILPVMTAVVISTVMSRALKKENIYSLKLIRRGVNIDQEETTDIMRTITVQDAMTRDFPRVTSTMRLIDLLKTFRRKGYWGYPVVDPKGKLVGIVTPTDVEQHLGEFSDGRTNKMVMDIATHSPFVAFPDETLDRVLANAEEDYGSIPVVSRDDPQKLLGVLRRNDIISAYRKKKLIFAPPTTPPAPDTGK
jgi:CIC family chloride channel protein